MFRSPVTQAQITAAAEAFAAQLPEGFTVAPSGYTHRTACTCGWFKMDAMVSQVRAHAEKCAA